MWNLKKRKAKLVDTENRLVVAKGRERGSGVTCMKVKRH